MDHQIEKIITEIENSDFLNEKEDIDLTSKRQLPFQIINALGPKFQVTVEKLSPLLENMDGVRRVSKRQDNNGKMVDSSSSKSTPLEFLALIAVAAGLVEIDQKLDAIKESQEEILSYLVQKEKSELRGDLNFLTGTLSNFKFNLDNKQYKNNNHIKVLDIRQSADQKIIFYCERIRGKLKKKAGWLGDKDVEKQINVVRLEFANYQFALYMYAFSSLVDVLLLGNYDPTYLTGIIDRIDEYMQDYRDLYDQSYGLLEEYYQSSIQSNVLKGLAGMSKVAGKTIARIPVIGEKQIDESLIDSGEKIDDYVSKRTEQTMKTFLRAEKEYVRPFVDHIQQINELHNEDLEIFIDKDNVYWGVKKED